MSDPLTDAANAISTSSPAIRRFAQLAAQRIEALEQAASPPVAATMPRQGVSIPLASLAADADWILDRIVEVGNGHPMFVRTDWWPGSAQFAAVAPKIAARGLVALPILNYDPATRPSASVYAAQAAQLAALYPFVNLLNEPNLGGWTASDAATYTKAAYAAIGGKALVIGPSCGFNKGGGHPPADVLAWNQAYHDAGGRQDVGAVTCYGDATYADPAWNGWSVVPQIRALLGGRLIVLEGGWRVTGSTLTPYNRASMTDAQYQDITVQTGMEARAAGRIESFICFTMPNTTPDHGYGLVDDTKVKRPAFATFQRLAA